MIIYQIYPRSFLDTDGDGIGDLAGIVHKIPYIARLGADAIWISPFFTSPMKGFGYDVADYRGVDPMFGTLEDFDMVIKTAHDHNLKVMIDQVWGHSSDQHDWFQQSKLSRNSDKADWYIWADAKPDGFFPNNWMSIFGGSAWTWSATRKQYYLHHFLVSQPALNLSHPDVFKAVMDDSLFWLERGVDGFRVDALPHFLVDPKLRDNPPLKKGKKAKTFTTSENPREMQDNIYTQSLPSLMPWIEDVRTYLKKHGHDPLMMAEIMTGGMKLASQCVAGDCRMQIAYSGELISQDLTTKNILKIMANLKKHYSDPSRMCWSLGNHDVTRLWSRLQSRRNPLEYWYLVVAWYFSLEGYLCWYQGDELGVSEGDIPFEQIQDPAALTFWPEFKGRDGCRTPMPWQKDAPNAGFSTGKPWLPIPADHLLQAVDQLENADGSMLEFTRFCMQLRKTHPALATGSMQVTEPGGGVIEITRQEGKQKIRCVFNFSETASYAVEAQGKMLFERHYADGKLAPCGFLITA